jgi:hypothetical protein
MATVPPWEEPGAVRRDCEPHRTPWLHLLTGLTLIASILSACCPVFALVSVPLALALWAAVRHDLAMMDAGRMDPAGRGLAQDVRGAVFPFLLLPVVGAGVWAAYLLLQMVKP